MCRGLTGIHHGDVQGPRVLVLMLGGHREPEFVLVWPSGSWLWVSCKAFLLGKGSWDPLWLPN